jgi:hypothetical protein
MRGIDVLRRLQKGELIEDEAAIATWRLQIARSP